MNDEKWNEMKIQIKEAIDKMVEAGYEKDNIKIVFNERKYKKEEFFENVILEYDNLQENVDFIVMPKYSTFLKRNGVVEL